MELKALNKLGFSKSQISSILGGAGAGGNCGTCDTGFPAGVFSQKTSSFAGSFSFFLLSVCFSSLCG
jgi:hypothetical protein